MPKLDYSLVIQHVGGDYGNMIYWAMDWMEREQCQSIEDVIDISTGSAHLYDNVNYLQRYFDHNKLLDYKFNSVNKSIVRFHYEFLNVQNDLLDSAKQTKTIVINFDKCILECLQNRSLKMPEQANAKIKNISDFAEGFRSLILISNIINSTKHENLYHLNMNRLVNDPVNCLIDCYSWWKNKKPIRNKKEIEKSIEYWIDTQPYLNYDFKFLTENIKDNIGLNLLDIKNKSSIDSVYHEIESIIRADQIRTTQGNLITRSEDKIKNFTIRNLYHKI